jgi:hypothetical protein
MQDVFWYIKEAIDAYFAGGPFQLTVKAGCLIGRKPDGARRGRAPDDADPEGSDGTITTPFALATTFDTEADSSFDDMETGWPWPPGAIADGSILGAPDDPALDAPAGPDDPAPAPAIDESSPAEQELDAFIDGKKRPHHLVD